MAFLSRSHAYPGTRTTLHIMDLGFAHPAAPSTSPSSHCACQPAYMPGTNALRGAGRSSTNSPQSTRNNLQRQPLTVRSNQKANVHSKHDLDLRAKTKINPARRLIFNPMQGARRMMITHFTDHLLAGTAARGANTVERIGASRPNRACLRHV